jgi:NAD(P)-dependent dehydrogenase (short-subunit alcohol dehydrogenase family)
MGRFDGRVALVSGAASGIGAAVAVRLAEEGGTVLRSDVVAIDGGVVCDVTDQASCVEAVAAAVSRHGRLDVLVNVAGIGIGRRIGEVTAEEWRRVLDVNLTGTFLLSQAALAPLLEGASSTWPRWPD